MPSSLADFHSKPPSPAPSTASAPTGGIKRKREFLVAQPAKVAKPNVGGNELLSQQVLATQYLKEKGLERSFQDIINYLSLQHADAAALNKFRFILERHATRIEYNPKGLGGVGSYKYKPIIENVTNGEQLIYYLRGRPTSVGIKFDELKDGWQDAAMTIDKLETEGNLLVLRDKRGVIRTVWLDEPILNQETLPSLKSVWLSSKLPATSEDLRAKLESAGLKSTSEHREKPKVPLRKEPKRKGPRKGGRMTNIHMNHILKDYSHKRR